MIRKIILLIDVNFNERHYKRFGIDILQAEGFEVEIWSMLYVYFPAYKSHSFHINNPYTGDNFITIKSMKDFYNRLRSQNTKQCHVITTFAGASPYLLSKSLALHALMGLCGVTYSNVYISSVEWLFTPIEKKSRAARFLEELKKRVISYTVYKPRFSFLASKEVLRLASRSMRAKRVYIHIPNYDIYLENKDAEANRAESETAVFLDTYYPFHSEYKMIGVTSPIKNIAKYYDELCNFFDIVEKKYNVKVIIAAHPTANYRDKPDYFKGRAVEYGKTPELVRKSRFVIDEISTSLDFAVMYNVPIVFVASGQLLANTTESIRINLYSAFFKTRYINLSGVINENDIDAALKSSVKAYQKYKRKYIKIPETPEKLFFEVVAEYIKKI